MHGIRRVLVFCTLIAILPTVLIIIPLYLRHNFYADVAYAVMESDIMEINDGISTLFCSEHILRMNGTFNAFQMAQRPEITSYRKHIRLKKSINLPDDTLEYWGFYLLKSATVVLSVCSRFEGASILVVKGERNLRTCGLLEHNNEKEQTHDIFLPGANRQVKIIYESNAQEIDSKELLKSINLYNIDDIRKSSINISFENSLEKGFKISRNTDNNTGEHNATSDERDLKILYHTAASYVHKHKNDQQMKLNGTRKLRHAISRRRKIKKNRNNRIEQNRNIHNHIKEVQKLQRELYPYTVNEKNAHERAMKMENKLYYNKRFKRSRELIKPSLLDRGIRHGGNADKNMSESNDVSSVSSFEYGLFNCYDGAILLAHEFEPSNQCTDISYLISGKHMQASHHVEEDGYYYYIFYSDNDIVSNDIYAVFDIYKPTFQYENVTKSCINQTECTFSLNLMSPDRVIVEIPTKDGIEYDELDDVNMLISTCHPRMGAYIIFPIAILFLILGCAFM